MAAVKWEVESSELILSVDNERVAKISGGLCNDIKNYTFNNGDITAYMDNYLANLIEYKAKVEEAPEADPPVTASDEVIGVITLKEAALAGDVTLQQVSKKYTLALEGTTAGTLEKADAPAANWKVENGITPYEGTKTATYYAEGTPTTWTVAQNGLSISYQAAQEGAAVAEIKGLKNGLRPEHLNVTSNRPIAFTTEPTMSDGETPTVTEEGVITIAESALPAGSDTQLTVTLTTGNDKYNLKLADGIAKFDATKGNATVGSVSGGTATITRTQSAGWEEVTGGGDTLTYKPQNTKTIATVSGLKSTATTGVTVSGTTVTIAKAALDTNTNTKVSIVDGGGTAENPADTAEGYYGFALALKDARENKLGFEKIDEYWTLDGTTAKYWNGRQEGWTLVTADGDDKGKIVYTAQDNNELATISKLNSDVKLGGNAVTVTGVTGAHSKIGTGTGNNFVEGITVSGNNIALSKAVLTHTADVTGESPFDNSTTLTQGKVLDSKTTENQSGTATTYQLGLVSSETTTPGTLGDISLSNITETEGVKSAKVQQDTSEGWTLKESNTKISYTEAGKKDLATISGLAVSTAGEDVKIVGNTVVLTANAIGTTKTVESSTVNCEVTLTNENGGNYTIARAEGVKEPETIPSTFKLGDLSTEADAPKSLKIMGTKAAGYTLDNNSDTRKITYTPAQDVEVATISNLNKIVVVKDDKIGTNTGDSNNFVEGITFDKDTNEKITGTITLKEAVLTDAEGAGKATTLDTSASASMNLGVTFKLALAEGIAAPATAVKEGSRKLAVTTESPNTTEDGKLNIVGTLEKGWTLDTTTNKITYTAEKTPILATISGLKPNSAVGTNVTLGTDGKITLKKDILATDGLTANSKVTITTTITDGGLTAGQTDSLKDSYKFALNENVDAPGKTVVGDPELKFPTETVNGVEKPKLDGTATLVGKKSAGWELDEENNTVKYVPEATGEVVATITGLFSKVANISGSVTFDKDSKTVKLNELALTNDNVTITNETTDTKYKLALVDYTPTSADTLKRTYTEANNTIGFESINYWDKSGTTAKYYSTKREGWTLDATNNDKITYKAAENGTLLATITNLSSDFVLIDDDSVLKDKSEKLYYIDIGTAEEVPNPEAAVDPELPATYPEYTSGVSVSAEKVITLSKNILGTTASKPMVLTTTTDGTGYTLALDARTDNEYKDLVVPQSAESAKVWELGATTKYKEVSEEFWKLTDKKITYTPQTSGTVLATITGLNPAVDAVDFGTPKDYYNETGEGAQQTITKGTITLNKHALNGRNVTINSNYYKLALNAETGLQNADKRVDAPELTNPKWELNDAHTIATYTAKVSEGYEATSDGSSVIYTAAADSKEIAKVTGLSGDKKLDVSDNKSYIGILNESDGSVTQGLKLASKVITLTKDVLGTSNLAVTGTNYTLALDGTVSSSAAQDNVWRVNGTTATYKKVTKAYYDLNDKATAITYKPEADVELTKTEGGTTKTVANQTIYATVTGLKRGLTVADNGQSLNGTDENGNAADGVLTLNTSTKAVTLTKDALGTSNVEVKEGDAAETDKYTLAFTNDTNKKPAAPQDGDKFTWSVSGTTATLKGTSTEGYTLDTATSSETKDKKIIYTPANANKTFAVLTGLKSGITASELNTTDDDEPIEHDPTAKTLTLDKRVLGTTDVTLDKTNSVAGYTLDLDSASTANNVATTGAPNKVWDVSGTTATYKNVTEAFYTPAKQDGSTGNDKITYKGRTDGTVIATVTGLKSGLKVENDKIEGITLGTLNASTGAFSEDANGTVIQLSKDVLGTTEAAIGQSSYTLALGEGAAPERDGGTFWTISGGTNANYQFKQTAGHTLDSTSKKAAYSQAGTKTIVTIEGLKSGLKATDVEAGITVSNEEKDYTVSKSVLGTNATTTLKNGDAVSTEVFANYKIALATEADDKPAKPTADQVGWVKDGSNFILKSFTTPGYTIATGDKPKTITYTGWANEKDLATVTGLNTKAKLDTATRQIYGIDLTKLTATGAHTVTLKDASVFSGKNVTIAKAANAAAEYTLAVDNSQNPKYSYEWAFKKGNKNGTATLTETMSAGYTLDSNASSETKGQIVHHNKETVTTTIAGLNNNVVVKDADKTKIGIYNSSASADSQYTGITFTAGNDTDGILKAGAIKLGANVLAEANVTLTNKSGGGKYTLALETTGDNKVTVGSEGDPEWHKTNDTTAIYRTMTSQGYAVAGSTDSTKITYYSDANGTSTTLATLKGINKNATVTDLGSSITVTGPTTTTTTSGANVTGNNADPAPATTTTTTPGKFTITDRKILSTSNLTLTGNDPNYKDYQLALDSTNNDLKVTDIEPENATWTYSKGTANLNVGKTDGWSIKQTKGAKTETTADDAFDYKTIVYTKPAPVTIATVSGLAAPTKQKPDLIAVNPEGKKTLIDENGKDVVVFGFEKTKKASGTTPAEYKGTITLSANALTNKNVTVTIPKKITGYAFELATDGDVFEPAEDGDNYWTADGKGKAVYQYDTAAGYTLDKQKEADTLQNKLTYSKEKTTTLATITGLATPATVRKDSSKTAVAEIKKDAKATEIDGIGVSSDPVADDTTTQENEFKNGVLLLSNPSILGNKVTVTGDYEFNIADEYKVKDGGSQWYFKGGTATYKEYTLEGYAFAKIKNDDNKKVVNYKPETAGKTLVTIKGLAKKIGTNNITDEMVNGNGLLVVNEDHTVTISKDITGTATITLVNGVETPKSGSTPATYYDYQIDAANSTYTTRVTDAPVWTFNKGTATLKQATSAGFTLGELGTNGQQKLTYSKEVTPAVATVKGLNPNLAVATEDNIPAGGTQTVGQIYAATTTGTGKNAATTINADASAPAISYDGNVITVTKDALTAKNVTLGKKDEYTLKLDSGVVNKAENVDEWVVSGTTANYKNYDRAYHELNEGSKGITYVKPTKGITYATVTGLKKDTTIDTTTAFSGNKESGTLTLKAENLGEKTVKIASKVAGKDTFTLALSLTDTDTLAKTSELTTGSWSAVSGGKSTLSGTQSAGFYAEFGGKQLTYLKANKSVTVATITGLKNGATVSESGGTVTLDANDLNKKNVTITTAMGPTTYKLSIDNSLKPTIDFGTTATSEADLSKTTNENPGKTEAVNKKIGWTVSSSTGTLKGYVKTAGYTLSESETAITYTGETARNKAKVPKSNPVEYTYTYKDATTLATFKGINSSSKPNDKPTDTGTGKITLSKSNINGNTLTLSGGTFAVEVNANGKSIVGSAGADNITAQGSKMNITGGKGDDKIKFASGGGNTLVYSNGDGNDIVEGFNFNSDKIQVKSGAVSVGLGCSDHVIVKVGAGSIDLGQYIQGTTPTKIDILDKKGNKTTYAIAGATAGGSGNVLLEDNNYSMDAASLSDLVQGDSASFTPYDFSSNFSLTKEDKFIPAATYSDKK